jgi:hypothetical protein
LELSREQDFLTLFRKYIRFELKDQTDMKHSYRQASSQQVKICLQWSKFKHQDVHTSRLILLKRHK